MSDAWTNKHKDYAGRGWIDKPSLFAETVITYFPATGKVLELGAGQGQDTRFFAEHGYEVVSTDLEQSALDLSKELPFENEAFDVVYAHLSLHYFDDATTKSLLAEIRRVLRPGGMLAFLVNSASDPEASMGVEIEPSYRRVEGVIKRFFTVQMAEAYTTQFEARLLDDQGETYKDIDKGVHNLIRYIGTKPE